MFAWEPHVVSEVGPNLVEGLADGFCVLIKCNVLSPLKDGKFISFEVFFIVFYNKCKDFSIQTGTEIDAWYSLQEEPEENFMSKQGQTELNSALPFVTNRI